MLLLLLLLLLLVLLLLFLLLLLLLLLLVFLFLLLLIHNTQSLTLGSCLVYSDLIPPPPKTPANYTGTNNSTYHTSSFMLMLSQSYYVNTPGL